MARPIDARFTIEEKHQRVARFYALMQARSMTKRDAAAYLAVDPATVRRWLRLSSPYYGCISSKVLDRLALAEPVTVHAPPTTRTKVRTYLQKELANGRERSSWELWKETGASRSLVTSVARELGVTRRYHEPSRHMLWSLPTPAAPIGVQSA